MNTEDRISVEQANTAFYRALESGVIERMDEAWAHDTWVRCVHPGWDMLTGWNQVRESWVMIFEGGQKMRASPSDVWVYVSGDFAWVICTENITIFNESSFDSAQAAATNLFIRRDGRWLMVHHHASAIPVIVPDDSSDTIQ
jgi:ketosteroid isomerase-like protein